MTVTKEKANEIVALHIADKSQNEIVAITGMNKVYVNNVINAYLAFKDIQGNTPGNLSGIALQPIRQEVPVNDTSAANYYNTKRIGDLEEQLAEIKRNNNTLQNEYDTLRKQHNELLINHRTIEQRHELEKNAIIQQNQLTQTKGLSGFLDKTLNNEKVIDRLLMFADYKLMGGGGQPNQAAAAQPVHPLINDATVVNDITVGTMIREILDVFSSYKAEDIADLYRLVGSFCMKPGLLQKVSQETTAYVQKMEQLKLQNDNNNDTPSND